MNSQFDIFDIKSINNQAKTLENSTYTSVINLINTNRQIYTLHLFNSLTSNNRMINQDYILSASVKPIPSLRVFLPQISQYISMFVQYMTKNLTQFAHEISLLQNTKDTASLIYLTIPSMFQYFISEESINDAFIFYGCLMRFNDVENFSQFVKPFFLAPCLCGFRENLFRNIFWKNLFKITSISKEETPTKIFKILTETLVFLPTAHLNLLKLLSCNYNEKDFSYFIINVMIILQLKDRIKVSPLFRNNSSICNVDELFSILRNSTFPNKLAGKISVMNSTYFYQKSFSKKIDLYIFRYDDIMELIYLNHQFSPIITNEIKKNNCKNLSKPFIVQVHKHLDDEFTEKELNLFYDTYPEVNEIKNFEYHYLLKNLKKITKYHYMDMIKEKKSTNTEMDIMLKSIDINDFIEYIQNNKLNKLIKKAKGFENYLSLRYREKCLKDLSKISKYYLNIISLQSAIKEAHFLEKKIWPDLLNLPNFGKIQFWYLIFAFDQKEQSIIMNLNIKIIEKVFMLMIDKMTTKKLTLIESINRVIWEANTVLSLVDSHSSFLDRFIVLIFYLEEIEKVSFACGDNDNKLKDQIIYNSISACSSAWVLKTLVYFHLIAIKDERFCHLCSKSFLDIWASFTVSFTNIIASDEYLLSSFSSLMNLRISFDI